MSQPTSPLAQRPANVTELDSKAAQAPTSVPSPDSPVSPKHKDAPGTVRFSSQLQEIEPENSLHTTETMTTDRQPLTAEQQEELRNLSRSLQQQNCQLQKRRMSNFVFEPVSLPASRVPSSEGTSRPGSVATRHGPSTAQAQTPPLTPAGSGSKEQPREQSDVQVSEITPQSSGPPPPSAATTTSASATSTGPASTTPTSIASQSEKSDSKQRHASLVSPGGSRPSSRDDSPNRRASAAHPHTPGGDHDDPYSRNKRASQAPGILDSRFVFGNKDNRRHSSLFSSAAAPRSDSTDAKAHDRYGSTASQGGRVAGEDHTHHRGSMADLKRFFHIGHHHHKKSKDSTSSARASVAKSGASTPPHHTPSVSMPFGEDHGLESKYGKFGKMLGSGAGGSVRLMKRPSDGVTFAVKQFRERHAGESEKEYTKKVTAEFCIGSTLHHGNIIETMDIVQEKGRWYEVMEYAPFDLFAIVMTGKMSREEVACCFSQIFAGVVYLHSMGLAHRDLKLDNVVVNEHGIMKIIDFGSAIVFRYPFEDDIVLSTGCVGSDPYLAPEVYDSPRYDPRPTDVWSLAIIFACMSLRRFPWKAPRLSDNSYKLFAAPPTPGTPPAENAKRRSKANLNDETNPSSRSSTTDGGPKSETSSVTTKDGTSRTEPRSETIKGPWRLLRLLPRESRNIISLMLEIDPKKRATIEAMEEDPWIANIPTCKQIDHGQVIKATGHTHTLEPGHSPDDK